MATALQMASLIGVVPAAQRTMRVWLVPASVTLAQWQLESGWGQSQLARQANNFFGIKAVQGESYMEFQTHEYIKGRNIVEMAAFASYPSAMESFDAHGRLLATLPRYSPAMKLVADPIAFGNVLHACGYSTTADYGARLSAQIHDYDLTQYDIIPSPDQPVTDKEAA